MEPFVYMQMTATEDQGASFSAPAEFQTPIMVIKVAVFLIILFL
jgi:lipoprotein signal peptidase